MIEEDLFRRLKRQAAEKGYTLQRLTNDLLRRALSQPAHGSFKLRLEGWKATEQPGVVLLDRDKLFDLMTLEVRPMASSPQDLKQHLMATNDEFRKLADQYDSYDEQLQQLAGKTYLNEHEKVEEVRLIKLKLRLKDDMERIIQQYKKQRVA